MPKNVALPELRYRLFRPTLGNLEKLTASPGCTVVWWRFRIPVVSLRSTTG